MIINNKLIGRLGLYQAIVFERICQEGGSDQFVMFGKDEFAKYIELSKTHYTTVYRALNDLFDDGYLSMKMADKKRAMYKYSRKGWTLLSELGLCVEDLYKDGFEEKRNV